MKKILILFLLVTNYCFSQTSGITYQAVVYNPNGEELPGEDNSYAPLTNKNICLQFGIVDNTGTTEYQEQVQVTTDNFGMVNLLIGTSTQTGGYSTGFNGVVWSADSKFLKVDIDIKGSCSNFEELSNQPFTYVPFAYYSPASDIPGPAGDDGLSAYEIWISLGNSGTEQEFIDSLTGPQGSPGVPGDDGGSGLSAYEIWVSLGNSGTEQEFIDSLTGPQGSPGLPGVPGTPGDDGQQGVKSLINTTEEPAGPNCDTGGTRIEVGIDTNNNNILDTDEIDDSLTRFICNGEVATKTLINSIAEEPGDNCINGGVKIEVGVDVNFNGVLETDEIDDLLTKFICNGNDGVDGQDGEDGQNNGGSASFFNSVEDLEIIDIVQYSCQTGGDPVGFIASAGSGWTQDNANYTSCYQTPNTIWRQGCSAELIWPGPPDLCSIDISSPVPSESEYVYEDLNSSKIEITPNYGKECYETIMKIEFTDSNGQLISSFVEHQFVNNGYVQTDFFASDTTQEFNLNLINPHTNSSNYQQPPVKLIFNLPNAASNLKISIEALAPTQFPSGCSQASYLAIIPAGYNNGVGGSPSLDYLNTVNSGPLTVKVFR